MRKQENEKRCRGASWRCGCIATTTVEINGKTVHCCDCCEKEYTKEVIPAILENENPANGIECEECAGKSTPTSFDGIVSVAEDGALKYLCKCCHDKIKESTE